MINYILFFFLKGMINYIFDKTLRTINQFLLEFVVVDTIYNIEL